MDNADKIKQYLESQGVEYQGINHAPAASAEEYHNTLHTRYEEQAKALLVKYKNDTEKGFVVVTIQAQKRADLEVLRQVLDAKEVKMAHKDQLVEVTGCNFGELPPLGKIFGLKLMMDKDLLQEEKIYFNAGRLDFSIAIDPKEIQRLENPILF